MTITQRKVIPAVLCLLRWGWVCTKTWTHLTGTKSCTHVSVTTLPREDAVLPDYDGNSYTGKTPFYIESAPNTYD